MVLQSIATETVMEGLSDPDISRLFQYAVSKKTDRSRWVLESCGCCSAKLDYLLMQVWQKALKGSE